MGNADDGDLRDGGVSRDRVLDLDGVHILAAGNDHVVEAVDKVDVAVGIDVADVAGVIPAASHHVLCLFGAVPVLAEEVSALGAHLALLPACHGGSVFILDRELDADDGPPGRAQDVAALRVVVGREES